MTKSIPEGFHSVTPQLTIKGCAEAIEFYKKALGATEKSRAVDPSGKKVWHAELQIGNSIIFVNDDFAEMGNTPTKTELWIYGDEVDARFNRATAAGAKVKMPLADMFWGDRLGTVIDPWGNEWSLAQRTRELTPEQMKVEQDKMVAAMKAKK